MTTNYQMIDEWGIPVTLFEEMGILLESASKDDAILMWPVTILGQREADGYDLHVTLNWGKWTGSEEELRASVSKSLEGQRLNLPSFSEWGTAEFQGREKKFKVLTLPQLKSFVVSLRKSVSGVFQDRFGDGYTPHISVSEELWQHIDSNKLTPKETQLKVGDLELRLGDKILDTYGATVESLEEARVVPASQKMVLIDMAKNDRRWREWPGGFYAPEGELRARDQERLFSNYVIWHVMRSLLRKGLITQKVEKGISFFSITQDGMAIVGF